MTPATTPPPFVLSAHGWEQLPAVTNLPCPLGRASDSNTKTRPKKKKRERETSSKGPTLYERDWERSEEWRELSAWGPYVLRMWYWTSHAQVKQLRCHRRLESSQCLVTWACLSGIWCPLTWLDHPLREGKKIHSNYSDRVLTGPHSLEYIYVCVVVTQLRSTLCDPMDPSVRGILQARILERVAISFSKNIYIDVCIFLEYVYVCVCVSPRNTHTYIYIYVSGLFLFPFSH